MALEVLKDIKSINGFNVATSKRVSNSFIGLDYINNMITFQIQKGPIKDSGVNGCQVDTIVEAAKLIVEGLNKNYPCRENSMAITKLDEALMWMRERK